MPDATDARASLVLRQQLERYLRHVGIERGRSANTVAAYRRDLDGFLTFLGEQGGGTADDLTTAAVTGFARGLRERQHPLAASSVARALSSVRGFTRFLVEEGLLESDPAVEVSPPKLPMRLPKALTIEQVESLLAATDGDELDRVRDKALLELLYGTGARVSEAVSLNVDDLIGDEGT
ncbi:MAG: site-specific integrase, partial [Pseudolysinimonas sp.]